MGLDQVDTDRRLYRVIAEVSRDQARRLFLHAQGLVGARPRRPDVPALLRRLGAVQLDTISVLARSHELVTYARLGAVGRKTVEDAYWGTPARTFEYWAHAACILPLEEWPWFAFRRRHYRRFGNEMEADLEPAKSEVLRRLKGEGPLTSGGLGGARFRGSAQPWDWSVGKRAVESLLVEGDVVCVERRSWKRVYDLAERSIPRALLDAEPGDEECLARLVSLAGARLGVATRADLADYFRLTRAQVASAIEATDLVPVNVRGWNEPAWADPAALESLGARGARGRHRSLLLSPFDSLVWHRARIERVFDFTHRLEAYVPRGKRVHGYFAMPLLARGRLAGRVDPARSGSTLIARTLSVETDAVPNMAAALVDAAGWVGCTSVALEEVRPSEVERPLTNALEALGA